MRRLSWLPLGVFLALLPSCDLGPGHGWTRVESDVNLIWNALGRIQPGGELKTSGSELLQFDSVQVTIANVAFETVAGNANSNFDPSNPPEGYTLCHNGHCHNTNDELISYDTIRLEMGEESPSSNWVTQAINETVQPETSKEQHLTKLHPGKCDDPRSTCEIGPNDLRAVRLTIESVKITGNWSDDAHPDSQNWFDIETSEKIPLTGYFPIQLGADGPRNLSLSVQLELGPRIWDTIQWENLASEGPKELTNAIKHHALIELEHY